MTDEEKRAHRAKQARERRAARKLDPVAEAAHWKKEAARVTAYKKRPDNVEATKQYYAKRARTNLATLRAYVAEEKMKSGCVDCGYRRHPAALDFDHVTDDKSFNISDLTSRTLAQVQAEIAKCVVRCSNCHRIITHLRLCERLGLHDALQPIADRFNPPDCAASSLP